MTGSVSKRGSLRASLWLGVAMICATVADAAAAQTVAAPQLDIPAQTLSATLTQIGRQTDAEVIFAPADVRGKRAPALRGSYTAQQALTIALQGTALGVRRTPQGAYLIQGGGAAPGESGAGSAAAEIESADIVVTAQKREENLQDVPISISVVGGEKLRQTGASQLTDFGPYVAGLQVDSGGTPGQSTLSLRGIAPIGASTTVGTYLDDAPVGSSSLYARSPSFTLDLLPYDIERVEILRGPQGTLYGASSIGGLLKYVTIAPDLDDFSGKAGAEIFGIRHGEDMGYAGQARVNIPLVPGKLGLAASYAYRKSPGYVDNVQTGKRDVNDYRQEGARISLLWQATEDFSVRLSGLWQTIDAADTARIIEDLATGARIGDGMSSFYYLEQPFRKKLHYYAATLDYDLGFAQLTSASTYSRTRTMQVQDVSRIYGAVFPLFGAPDAGLSPATLNLDLKKVTQEVRLTSPSRGRFEWQLGLFYTYEKSGNDQLVNAYDFGGAPIAGLDPFVVGSLPSTYREYAVFGNATYRFSDRFDVTGGLRWAKNRQRFSQISAGFLLPPGEVPGRSSEDVVTYSVSPRFHVGDDSMIYARVASGYRPGGPNLTLPGVPPMVGSDSLVNYELGFKSMLFDRRVTIDLAAFYMDWKDIQIGVVVNGASALANAGSARSQGVEAAITWQPVEGLRLGASGAYTDARLAADMPAGTGGLDGDRLPSIPKWSGSLTADYSTAVTDTVGIRLGAGLRHTGNRLSDVASSPLTLPIRSYSALDLNAALTIDDRWTVRAYARNVTDSGGAVSRGLSTDAFGQPSHILVVPTQPRTIGLAVDLAF
ncbi:TonB-dependent receptor domain-containing protein [Sphingomonas colocasiae]|uniref:TonB-dependent receptor n=1 Tax=Sphingomonas colocasiae TaxID=1848973 RepID=A0ABS7PKU2_9SPHN|nr:TonB-dependent receptor [Sphingomonas colocasiae]MBY8821906.1 TonB-dependent receptor [Sphingomonas colocasiae]